MAVKVPGLSDFVNASVSSPVAKIVSGLPAAVSASDSRADFKGNMKSSLRLGEESAKAALKENGMRAAIGTLSNINPNLGKLAKKILRRNFGDEIELPPVDPPINPNSWLALGRKRLDPLMSYTWDVLMPEIDELSLPNYMIEEVQFTLPSYQDWNVYRNGTFAYYAGPQDVGTLTLVFYEDVRMSSSKYIGAWRKQVQNEDGTFNAPSEYWNTISVILQDNNHEPIAELVASGCFPTTRDGYTLNSGASDRSSISVTFAVNNLDFQFLQTSPIVEKGQGDPNSKGKSSLKDDLWAAALGDTSALKGRVTDSVKGGMKKAAGIVKSHLPVKIKV